MRNYRHHVLRVLWFGLYVLLVSGSSYCTIQTWVHGVDGFTRLISNLTWILNLPAWILLFLLHGPGIRTDPFWIVMVNIIGWIGWVGLFWVVCGRNPKRMVGRTQDRPSVPVDAGRRAFVARSTLGGIGAFAGASAVYGTLIEPTQLQVRAYSIPIPGIHPQLDGFRIVHVSDTHLGPRIPMGYILDAYQRAVDLDPDLIVHTGDHIHDGVREIDDAAAMCRILVEGARVGVVGTLGNHDWWGDGDRLSAALTDAGVRMIDNARLFLTPDGRLVETPDEECLAIAGIGDLTDGEVRVDRALGEIDPTIPRVVLAHNPDTAEIPELKGPASPRVDLMLSGHTHGGQVHIPFIGTPVVPSRFGQKYAGGMVQGPRFRVLVSRGIGMSMLPVRVGVPPEISVITLRA